MVKVVRDLGPLSNLVRDSISIQLMRMKKKKWLEWERRRIRSTSFFRCKLAAVKRKWKLRTNVYDNLKRKENKKKKKEAKAMLVSILTLHF